MKIVPNSLGIFFPSESNKLIKLFNKYNKSDVDLSSRLIIVPHAGYEYCGNLAFNAYKYLDKYADNIIVIAPIIYKQFYGSISCNAECFVTPLGDIIIEPFADEFDNNLFINEPALTVQLPFIKFFFPNATITPILYGCENYLNITKIITDNIDKSNIVIVSNLSRFIPEKENLKLDAEVIRKIEKLEITDFDVELADGAVGICGAIKYAQNNKLKIKKIANSNSAKVNNDTSNVIGYGTWYLTQ